MNLFDRHRAHPRTRGDSHRGKDGKEDQVNLGELADAKPDDDERQICEWRQGPIELDRRIEDAPCPAAYPHEDTDWNRGHTGKKERAEYARQTGQRVCLEGRTGKTRSDGKDELVIPRVRGR